MSLYTLGMCTVLGTSTNLIVAARYEEDFPGETPLDLFAPATYGVAAVLCGTAYMAIAGRFDGMQPPRAAVDFTSEDVKESRKSAWNGGHEALANRHGWSTHTRPQSTRSRRLSEAQQKVLPRQKEDIPRMILAGVTVLAVILLAATDLVSIDVGALCASVLFIVTGCIGAADAYASIDGRVMLAIVCSFGVSVATNEDHTKVAGIVADSIVGAFAPLGPTGILAAVCVISCVVGSVISNNAAALLLYPIVVDLAETTEGVCARARLPACLPACLSACLPACLPACLSVCLSLTAFLSVCLSVCL